MEYTTSQSHKSTSYYFEVADFECVIDFSSGDGNGLYLLPSLRPFLTEHKAGSRLLFSLRVDDQTKPWPKDRRERIRAFDTGNGDTIVDLLDNGGYQYIIKDIHGHECCLLITNKDFSECQCALNGNYTMRNFGLNNALMLVFAFAAGYRDTLLIHASLVRNNGWGYPFIAKSGTGKSTQVSMWLRYIPGCDLMNDDNPIIRIIGEDIFIYGSPWSGKTPCYRKEKAKLGAITRIDRAKTNSIEKLSPIDAFASFLPSCSSMKWDSDIFDHICNTIGRVIERVPVYTLHCLPNQEAAEICFQEIHQNNGHGRD